MPRTKDTRPTLRQLLNDPDVVLVMTPALEVEGQDRRYYLPEDFIEVVEHGISPLLSPSVLEAEALTIDQQVHVRAGRRVPLHALQIYVIRRGQSARYGEVDTVFYEQ